MTKALSWNTIGAGTSTRESAREAARREGKSIGEWLHGVIADHASDMGVADRDDAGQGRQDPSATKMRGTAPRLAQEPRVQADMVQHPVGIDRGNDEPRREHLESDGEDLLEEAFQAMEMRALRAERRTKEALTSFAKLLDTNEQKREQERQSIVDLAKKLTTLESTLVDRAKVEDNPIRGSLARLEARLEVIGRRSAEEAVARAISPVSANEPATRPASALPRDEALPATPAPVPAMTPASPALSIPAVPTAASRGGESLAQAAPPATRPSMREAGALQAARRPLASPRRFDNAVSEIARRQQSLESGISVLDEQPSSPAVPAVRPVAPQSASRPALSAPMEAMQSEMAGLARAVEEMRRELLRGRDAPERHASDLDSMRAEITAITRSFQAFAPSGSVKALEDRIEAVADRIEASRDNGIREIVLRPIETMIGELRRAMKDLDQSEPLSQLGTQVQAIAGKIGSLEEAGISANAALDTIHKEVGALRHAVVTLDPRQSVGEIEGGIRAIAAKLEHLERGGIAGAALASIQEQVDEIRTLVAATATRHVAVEQIENRFASLVQRVERQVTAKPDVGQLENLIRDLGRKIEAVQAPNSGAHAIEALQRQIGLLATRFEKAESGLPSLAAIERSMRELFAHLEQTRASVETSSAREAVRTAMAENAGKAAGAPARDIAALKALHDEADVRTSSTLDAVHETLDTAVDRLGGLEAVLDNVRAGHTRPVIEPQPEARPAIMARSTDERRTALQISLGAPDPRHDSSFDRTARPIRTRAVDGRGKPTDLDDEAGRADFIAAARRAAQVAQSDPSVLAMKRPTASQAPATRAGLMARSRDFIASHKKPVLLGFAALFVIIGTMTVMQHIALSPEEIIADRAPAARPAAARLAAAAAPSSPISSASVAASGSMDHADLSPRILPSTAPSLAKQIAGSDPVQTGSLQTLPAFASRGGEVAPSPALASGLKTAAENGDGAAQYELGATYANGRAVPRDLKLAAKWYEKAAAQGIAPAQYRLASLYEKGTGIAQDRARAKTLYQQAADAGNPRAMHNLAVMLADGDGKPDYNGAAIWFRKAAQYGIHDSQFNLAILLARGLGVSQSLVQSYQWFAIAAAQNDPDAAKKRDEVGLQLSANDVAVAKALAAAFQPRVANPSATEVRPPLNGWDSVAPASHLNNATRAKISSL